MAVELYNKDGHVCLAFCDLVDEDHDHAVQCNQFLIANQGRGALIDPGGNMSYNALLMEMQRYFPSRQLDYVIASHADPDIIASINKWFVSSNCKLMISRIWERFVPHFTTGRDVAGRIIGIPDQGSNIRIGGATLKALPAHFLHSEGNFQFYDPISKILFSGDLGVSLIEGHDANAPVTDFDAHIPLMEGFHRRYMVSNKILRYWASMVRTLEIEQIVPQHGRRFVGKAMCKRLIDWLETLPCGIDVLDQRAYQVP
ncbi:MAG TPA: MBL fold metallo-hydrolase [Rhodocyclaceae bacterium]|nr:MBL fold metallo-hydrolase [Rhodocyclaceae bacterium]